MKIFISLLLLLAVSTFGATPDYKAFRGTGGITVVTNPPNGTIVIDGSSISSPTGGVSAATVTNIVTGLASPGLPVTSVQVNGTNAFSGSSSFLYTNGIVRIGAHDTNAPSAFVTFGTNAPNGRVMQFQSIDQTNIGDFVLNFSTTANLGSSGGNPVMQWAYNLDSGGSVIDNRDTGFGFGLEGNYDVGNARYNEAHLYLVATNGTQYRPWSFVINKANTNSWACHWSASSFDIAQPGQAGTPTPYFVVNTANMSYSPSGGTNGLQIHGDNDSLSISRTGVGTTPLNILSGWSTVQLPGMLLRTASYNSHTILSEFTKGIEMGDFFIRLYNTAGAAYTGVWNSTNGNLLIGATLGSYSNAVITVVSPALSVTGRVSAASGTFTNTTTVGGLLFGAAGTGLANITGATNGVLTLYDGTVSTFNRLNFGGTGAEAPSLGRTNGDLVVFGANGLFGGGNTNRLLIHGGLTVGPPTTTTTITNILSTTATLDFPQLEFGGSTDLPVTLTGAADGDVCEVSAPVASIGPFNVIYTAFASNGVVYVRCASYAVAQDPASGVFRVVAKKFK